MISEKESKSEIESDLKLRNTLDGTELEINQIRLSKRSA